MPSARNEVIAGKFSGTYVKYGFGDVYVVIKRVSRYDILDTKLSLNSYGDLEVRKPYVSQYDIITEEKMKSGTSAIMRGALGAAVLGPIGILAGLTAKNKGIHTIAIEWESGDKSLLEVDDKIYKQLVKDLF